jgi:spore maturation protein CgeB
VRIFYAVGNKPNAALAGSKVWFHNLYLSLVDLGHEVSVFEFDLEPFYDNADVSRQRQAAFSDRHRPTLERELLRQIREAHANRPIDMFFAYFYGSFVSPGTIAAIRELGIVTVNWYCNGSYQFNLVAAIAPAFDFCLVPERYRLEDYRRVGAHPIYCQEAANPTVYHPYDVTRDTDVSFVGACYGDRPFYVRSLLDAGIGVQVFGPGWLDLTPGQPPLSSLTRGLRSAKRAVLGRPPIAPMLDVGCCGGPVSDEEMVRMYSRSRISLGFSTVGETFGDEAPIKQVRLRDFEAPMSGAFYLVEYMEELEEFFIPGEEIGVYRDREDLVEKARYYLAHDAEREAIRRAGHARAMKEHSWQARLRGAFEAMGLPGGEWVSSAEAGG